MSEILTSVESQIITPSPDGENEVTTRSILFPMTFRVMVSPLAMALPSSTCLRYSSPPCSLSCSVGEKVIFSAFLAATFLIATLSSRATPALRLVEPSILMIPRFASSGAPLSTLATVFLLPSICTMSPTLMPRMSMSSGSRRTMPLPVSPAFSSATLMAFSFVMLVPPLILMRSPRSADSRPHRHRPPL